MVTADWLRLKDGPGPGVVLAVDFQSGRDEPALADLAPLLDLPYPVWQPAPPDGVAPDAWFATWLRDARDLDVRAVLGLCAGGTLACALAAAVGGNPPVVLLDPRGVTGEVMEHQFLLGMNQFDEFVDDAELTAVRERVATGCGESDPPDSAAMLAKEYGAIVHRVFDELGVEEDVTQEVLQHFGACLDYLVASWHVSYATSDDTVLTLFSQDYPEPLGLRGERRRIPVPHADLLTDPRVVAAVVARFTGAPEA